MLLDRKTLSAINAALRGSGKPVMKRRDFRFYYVFDQEFADGVAVVEILCTRREMYLVLDGEVIGWAEFNVAAIEACRTDARLFDRIFHIFDRGEATDAAAAAAAEPEMPSEPISAAAVAKAA